MDTELGEIKASIARIEERTQAILEGQDRNAKDLDAHEERDREDFKEVHGRINKLERRQNWFIGIGTGLIFFVSTTWAIIKEFFGG